MQAHGVPDAARRSSASVTVIEREGATVFMPAGIPDQRPAMVFLPGGGVDPAAYVPLVRAIAEAGWPAALVRLPWRVAFTDAAEAQVWTRVVGVRGGRGAHGGRSCSAATRAARRSPRGLRIAIAKTWPRCCSSAPPILAIRTCRR
jgi:hypothetical protein